MPYPIEIWTIRQSFRFRRPRGRFSTGRSSFAGPATPLSNSEGGGSRSHLNRVERRLAWPAGAHRGRVWEPTVFPSQIASSGGWLGQPSSSREGLGTDSV